MKTTTIQGKDVIISAKTLIWNALDAFRDMARTTDKVYLATYPKKSFYVSSSELERLINEIIANYA